MSSTAMRFIGTIHGDMCGYLLGNADSSPAYLLYSNEFSECIASSVVVNGELELEFTYDATNQTYKIKSVSQGITHGKYLTAIHHIDGEGVIFDTNFDGNITEWQVIDNGLFSEIIIPKTNLFLTIMDPDGSQLELRTANPDRGKSQKWKFKSATGI